MIKEIITEIARQKLLGVFDDLNTIEKIWKYILIFAEIIANKPWLAAIVIFGIAIIIFIIYIARACIFNKPYSTVVKKKVRSRSTSQEQNKLHRAGSNPDEIY